MRDHRITDEEASAVLRGETPEARQDLAAVADAVSMFRQASYEAPPQPSAALALRLDLERAERISTSADGMTASTSVLAPVASTPRTRRRRVSLSGFVGLGLAAKIAIGASAAAAVGITGTGVAGATGVLPTAAQEVFNEVTGQVPAEVVTDSGVDTKVDVKTSQEVKLDAEVQAELDEEAALKAAEDAVQSGLGTVEEQRQAALDAAEELGQTGVEKVEELGQTGLETVEGVGGAVDLGGDAGVDVGAGVEGH
jgi:hypothetical protein